MGQRFTRLDYTSCPHHRKYVVIWVQWAMIMDKLDKQDPEHQPVEAVTWCQIRLWVHLVPIAWTQSQRVHHGINEQLEWDWLTSQISLFSLVDMLLPPLLVQQENLKAHQPVTWRQDLIPKILHEDVVNGHRSNHEVLLLQLDQLKTPCPQVPSHCAKCKHLEHPGQVGAPLKWKLDWFCMWTKKEAFDNVSKWSGPVGQRSELLGGLHMDLVH